MLREMCGIIMTSEVKLNCTLNIGLLSIECFYKPINKPVTLKPSNQRIFNIFKTIEFWENPPVKILSFEMQKLIFTKKMVSVVFEYKTKADKRAIFPYLV